MATRPLCSHCGRSTILIESNALCCCSFCGKILVGKFSRNHENKLSDTSSDTSSVIDCEPSMSNEGYLTQIRISAQQKRGFDKTKFSNMRETGDSSSRSDSLENMNLMKQKKRNLPSVTCDHECFSSSCTKNENLTDTLFLMVSKLVKACDLQQQNQVPNEELSSYKECLLELQKLEGIKVSDFIKMVEVLKDEKNAIAFTMLKGSLRTAFIKSKCSSS